MFFIIVSQVTEDGKYCLVLVFEAKALQLSDFEKRQVWQLSSLVQTLLSFVLWLFFFTQMSYLIRFNAQILELTNLVLVLY